MCNYKQIFQDSKDKLSNYITPQEKFFKKLLQELKKRSVNTNVTFKDVIEIRSKAQKQIKVTQFKT
jgi:hypothetical protein